MRQREVGGIRCLGLGGTGVREGVVWGWLGGEVTAEVTQTGVRWARSGRRPVSGGSGGLRLHRPLV